MGKALGRFWDTTFGKDGAYGKAIEIRQQAWEAAGRFLTEAWKKTLRFAQDVGAWYHENIGKMIYRNIAWYDKQVLQPLKREPLTFIGRTIAAAVGVLAVALCVIYCYGWVVNVAIPWVTETAIPAVTGFLDSAVWPGVFDFSWVQAGKVFGYGKAIVDGNPLGLLYSAFSPLGYFDLESNFLIDGVITSALGEVHEGWDIL